MVDHATPNLPSRSLDATVTFSSALGFTVIFRDSGWLILSRGRLILEFFPDANRNPATSSFGSCLRLDDLDTFYSECRKSGIPERTVGWPRIEQPRHEASGLRIGALLDPDGSLLRLVGKWPADDGNVYWLRYSDAEVQVDTHLGGELPVFVETGHKLTEATTVEAAIRSVIDGFGAGRH